MGKRTRTRPQACQSKHAVPKHSRKTFATRAGFTLTRHMQLRKRLCTDSSSTHRDSTAAQSETHTQCTCWLSAYVSHGANASRWCRLHKDVIATVHKQVRLCCRMPLSLKKEYLRRTSWIWANLCNQHVYERGTHSYPSASWRDGIWKTETYNGQWGVHVQLSSFRTLKPPYKSLAEAEFLFSDPKNCTPIK